jgi:hypothetical protein
VVVLGCSNRKNRQSDSEIQEVIEIESEKKESLEHYEKGTYGYDVNLLRDFPNTVELKNGDSRLIISIKYHSRVMTSSSNGYEGRSYGWINHELIESGKVLPQFNPVGGEERFGLGRRVDSFHCILSPVVRSILKTGRYLQYIDTIPFDVFLATDSVAVFLKDMEVENYSNFKFRFELTRKVHLLGRSVIEDILGIRLPARCKTCGL